MPPKRKGKSQAGLRDELLALLREIREPIIVRYAELAGNPGRVAVHDAVIRDLEDGREARVTNVQLATALQRFGADRATVAAVAGAPAMFRVNADGEFIPDREVIDVRL